MDLVEPWYIPTQQRRDASRIEHYRSWVQQRGVQVANQRELQEWSTDQPENFWSSLWEYFELPARNGPALANAPVPVRPGITWFPGVRINYTQQVFAGQRRADTDVALIGIAEDGRRTDVTWHELRKQVGSLAAWLRSQGVGSGDRVVGYLPDIPQATIAFLATAAVGAVWAACGQDYAATAALARLGQLQPKVLFACGGYDYAGQYRSRLQESVDIRNGLPHLQAAVMIGGEFADDERAGWTSWDQATATNGDVSIDDLITEAVPFDHPLWVLFSSGTTGKPKGIMHGHGGVIIEHLKMLALYSDITHDSTFWWQTSPSWMMWNYRTSALLLGSTVVSYSGSPTWPSVDRIWQLAAQVKVDVLGISPAYVLACRQAGVRPVQDHDLSALQMIGATGAPLPDESYWWIASDVAPGVPVSSITGGTDVVTAFAAASPADSIWAGEISGACLGANLRAFDADGMALTGELGELVLTTAMPSMPVAFWNDLGGDRLHDAYFARYPGVWCHGDWVTITDRGSLIMHGRSDSTLNRQGVRMGSSEVYAAIETLPAVRDGLIVGVDGPNGSYWMPLFVTLADGVTLDDELRLAITTVIRREASPRHVPDEIIAVPGIPRTRTGKRLEVPIKRLLAGGRPEQIVDRNAVDDVNALDWFIDFAANRSTA